MDISLERIKLALQHEDVEGLIELGAPSDEYDTEALAILSALQAMPTSELNQSSLAAIIAVVWAESFGRTEEEIKQRMPAFLSIANRVIDKS
jgi:hypothetical protein